MTEPLHQDPWLTVYAGDCRAILAELEPESIHAVVTSPPYWGLRDYGAAGQLGVEPSPAAYVEALVGIFREVWRVLRPDGTVWLNLGDTYASSGGHNRNGDGSARLGRANLDAQNRGSYSTIAGGLKPKDLVGIPWRVALALQADGWWLRSDIVWSKPNATPESVEDRPTRSHEYLFLLARSERYYFDQDAVREPNGFNRWGGRIMTQPAETKYRPGDEATVAGAAVRRPGRTIDVFPDGGRNIRTVWTIPTLGYEGAHFATFPPDLVKPCILAGCPEGGVVLDPFAGSGTTGQVAQALSRRAVLIELNPEYLELAMARAGGVPLGL